MTRNLLIVVWLCVAALARGASAGQAYEAIDAGDVFVATVTRVDDKGATNGQPPRISFEVHEVLRGDPNIARSPAVWLPRFHGIDWGGEEAERLIAKWQRQPLKGPQVGKKLILGGRQIKPARQGEPAYVLFEFVHIPFTEQARREVIAQLKALREAAEEYQKQQEAAKQAQQQRYEQWRKQFDSTTVDRLTQRADAVAIGTISGATTFKIERMLKGRARMTSGDSYYVTLPQKGFDERIADLVSERRPRSILFLSESGLFVSVTDAHANLIDPYLGLAPADDAVVRAVEASLEKTPPPEPRPVVVISSFDRKVETELAAALGEKYEVVISRQFSAHGEHAVKHVRERIPAARVLVMIDRGPPYAVTAVRIEEDQSSTVYTGQWEAKQLNHGYQALLKTLPKS